MEHPLADPSSSAQFQVRGFKSFDVQAVYCAIDCTLQNTLIYQLCSSMKQAALLVQVMGFVQGSGKHQLPMDGDALALEDSDVKVSGIINQTECPLG